VRLRFICYRRRFNAHVAALSDELHKLGVNVTYAEILADASGLDEKAEVDGYTRKRQISLRTRTLTSPSSWAAS